MQDLGRVVFLGLDVVGLVGSERRFGARVGETCSVLRQLATLGEAVLRIVSFPVVMRRILELTDS